MATKKNPVPKNETKQQKFVRIAAPRVSKVLTSLRLLSNCAGSGYEYTPEQVSKILVVIERGFTDLRTSFAKKQSAKSEGFKF